VRGATRRTPGGARQEPGTGRKTADELDGSEPREEAIPLLVDEHAGRLFSLGLRFCGDPEEAQDLVQETFLQAFRKWHQFEGRARASTWLYAIAARVCRRFHRKKSGEPERMESLDELLPFAEQSMAVVPDEPLAAELREEAREQIEQAIAALPNAFRMPFVLKEIVGLSILEIAGVLGIKDATVKTRLHRARLRIRQAIDGSLPRRKVRPAIFSKQVCLDLLRAKQESLDRGTDFEFPDQVVCERCAEFFATLDLAQGICADIAKGEIPEALRLGLLEQIRAEGVG